MKLFFSLVLAALMTMTTGCSKVPAGHAGVKVYLLGGSKGVDAEVLPVGRHWIGWNEELYLFPTYKQNYVWTKEKTPESPTDEAISFQTKEGLEINADFGISYTLNKDKVALIFQKYRKGIDEITRVYLRNYVRDAINDFSSRMGVEEVYGEGKSRLLEAVTDRVKAQVINEGIEIEKVYLIGQFRLPEAVLNALNAKITATQTAQQRQNEVAEAKAEAEKKVAEARGEAESILAVARAEAEANKLKNQTISDSLIRFEFARRWNGELPTVMGSGSMPMFNVNDLVKARKGVSEETK